MKKLLLSVALLVLAANCLTLHTAAPSYLLTTPNFNTSTRKVIVKI